MDGFLKVDGIEGECKDARHGRWIDVSGVSWGASQEVVPAPEGGIRGGDAEVQAFSFTHLYDRASVGLFQACATGRQIPSVLFEGVLAHGDEPFVFLRAEFKDCLVTSVQAASAEAHVTETVEIVFRSVQIDSFERPL